MESQKLMKTSEVAEYLTISEKYLRRLIVKGEIPYIKLLNKRLFKKEEVDKWLINEKTVRNNNSKYLKQNRD